MASKAFSVSFKKLIATTSFPWSMSFTGTSLACYRCCAGVSSARSLLFTHSRLLCVPTLSHVRVAGLIHQTVLAGVEVLQDRSLAASLHV